MYPTMLKKGGVISNYVCYEENKHNCLHSVKFSSHQLFSHAWRKNPAPGFDQFMYFENLNVLLEDNLMLAQPLHAESEL